MPTSRPMLSETASSSERAVAQRTPGQVGRRLARPSPRNDNLDTRAMRCVRADGELAPKAFDAMTHADQPVGAGAIESLGRDTHAIVADLNTVIAVVQHQCQFDVLGLGVFQNVGQ